MKKIAKVFDNKEFLACITLDFEMDYGDRIGEFNILNDEKAINDLGKLFSDLDIPVSSFIRTDMLIKYPSVFDIVRYISQDYHCHSHSHNTKEFISEKEISQSAETFEKFFGYKAIGYRAPQGVLYDGDITLIKSLGFKFSSSIFPSYRPFKFNNLLFPINPFMYENGIIEFPFSVIPYIRFIISLSYIKLLGMNFCEILFSTFGLPKIIVFDSHLHDYIVNEESFEKLPYKYKKAWGIRKYSGIKYFKKFINILIDKNYKFITMTELYNKFKE